MPAPASTNQVELCGDAERAKMLPHPPVRDALPPVPSQAHSARCSPTALRRSAAGDFAKASSIHSCTLHCRRVSSAAPVSARQGAPGHRGPLHFSKACIRPPPRPFYCLLVGPSQRHQPLLLRPSSLEKASYALQSQLRRRDLGNTQGKVAVDYDHLASCHNSVPDYQVDRLRYMAFQLHDIPWPQFQNLAQGHLARAELKCRIQLYVTQQPDSRFHPTNPILTR